MSDLSSSIRNSAKAIIIRDGCVLLIRINDKDGEWYVLPGGGQRLGETLQEAVRRECMEEADIDVQVGQLRLVREYIAKNHGAPECNRHVHRVEFMFECKIDGDAVPDNGKRPDSNQIGLVWVPLDDLTTYELYPYGLGHILRDGFDSAGCEYMGDVE